MTTTMASDDWLLFALGILMCSIGGWMQWYFFVAIGSVCVVVGLLPKFFAGGQNGEKR